ncbi:MAG: hypothetical protein P8101_10075 [Candidatus Thiodiazotropha sp.]
MHQVEMVLDQIEKHTSDAIDGLKSLGTCCVVDSRNRTPFDVAIICDNRTVIDFLCEDKDCLNFCANIDKGLKKTIKQALEYSSSDDSYQKAEDFVKRTFGDETPLERTPLLQACRFNNHYAVEKLLAKKVNASAKDIAGLTAIDLCHEAGGDALLKFFISACRESGVQITLSEEILRKYVQDPGMLTLIRDACKPTVNNHRLLLAMYCSLIDVANVEYLLGKGVDVNKCTNSQYHPLFEACTSCLMWEWRHPDFPVLAYAYTKAYGDAAAQSIQVDNDLIANAESLEDIERLFQDALGKQDTAQNAARSTKLSTDELNAQLRKRLAIIDLLLGAGLDVSQAEKKCPDLFVSRLVGIKQPPILQKLAAHGFALKPETDEGDFLEEKDKAYLQKWVSRASADPLA